MFESNLSDLQQEAYTVEGYSKGIAFCVLGYELTYDEDYEWTGIPTVNYERVNVVMIGDDRIHTVDIGDLTPLSSLEYCHTCGQVGCTHNSYE